ncbi:DUF1802 family protein [Nostoc sp. ChiVER01]|uniref:DUF1802 family protein n=1 Tax=Nostoc sp. ChiVER01 TaxID=3075382 RepID=UPI002AD3A2DD|nr:DUF1802 family protein [Nostoc sp. ChiVER01]MDZ8225397.1 DUF1802 family protein [Nostoc sp. ChiVER01]
MSESVLIDQAICLPAQEVEALIQGRTIAIIARMFIDLGRQFALYPTNASTLLLPLERYYNANLNQIAINNVANVNSEKVLIKAWAKCELCQILDDTEHLDILSKSTVWSIEALKEILSQHNYIFLSYLRVYELDEPIEVSITAKNQFIPLSRPTIIIEPKPILNDRTFAHRKHQLEKLEPPLHPELEELQSAIASLTISQPAAKQLDDDIKVFLGWSNDKLIKQPDPNLAWINDIAKLGDRSIELENKKTNHEAGTDFEIIARRSLDFLGFKVEENYKGGAGGLDLYCSQPYPLVCECKAGKSIPDRAVEELDRIGRRHLKENYLQAVRLIIGPGKPTKNLKESAEISKISIINVMTLQKLVELKAKYPGAINLVELKQYLEPGQIDYKIGEYIDKADRDIKLRSHLIQLVKNYLENSGIKSAGVEALHGAYFGSHPPQPIKTAEMHEILIELSSPLTGYLGRIKGSDWNSDRFYFLRDLPTN